MNEELQRQLLAILKELKDGASPAWQMLVEQRAGYYTWNGWLHLAFALLLVVAGWLCVIAGRKTVRITINKVEDSIDRGALVALVITLAVSGALTFTISAIVLASNAFDDIARGAFPLGELIGSIR